MKSDLVVELGVQRIDSKTDAMNAEDAMNEICNMRVNSLDEE